jgi:hypothetical protein
MNDARQQNEKKDLYHVVCAPTVAVPRSTKIILRMIPAVMLKRI